MPYCRLIAVMMIFGFVPWFKFMYCRFTLQVVLVLAFGDDGKGACLLNGKVYEVCVT